MEIISEGILLILISNLPLDYSFAQFSEVFDTSATFFIRRFALSGAQVSLMQSGHVPPMHIRCMHRLCSGLLSAACARVFFFVRRSLLRLNRFNKSAHPGIIKPQKRESARGICWRNLPRKFKHESRIFMRARKLALATNPPRVVHNQATRRACCGCTAGAEKDTGMGILGHVCIPRSKCGSFANLNYTD